MASRFVRQSSYRHVFGTPSKPEFQFTEVPRVEKNEGPALAVSTKWLAIPIAGGGGPVIILKRDQFGRIPKPHPHFSFQKGYVTDAAFNPFNDDIIATASDDLSIKFTHITDGASGPEFKELATFSGHNKKPTGIYFNPVASDVFASVATDNTVKVWDVESAAEISSFEIFQDTPFHADWNKNGSEIAVTSKDRHLYVFDPRTDGKSALKFNGFQGGKRSSAFFTDRVTNGIVGAGFNNKGGRQLMIWDTRKADGAHLHAQDVDQSPGVFVAHMDNDNGVLYLAGKGDVGISYFEVTSEAPYLHFLSKADDGKTTMGAAWLPKRAVDVSKCEIAHVYKLVDGSVLPISFQVPRKSELFQKDLFPEAYAGQPALTVSEWKEGKNADPVLVSLDPKSKKGGAAPVVAAGPAKKTYAELESEVEALKKKVADLEAQLASK